MSEEIFKSSGTAFRLALPIGGLLVTFLFVVAETTIGETGVNLASHFANKIIKCRRYKWVNNTVINP